MFHGTWHILYACVHILLLLCNSNLFKGSSWLFPFLQPFVICGTTLTASHLYGDHFFHIQWPDI